jgi:hypothetical protein
VQPLILLLTRLTFCGQGQTGRPGNEAISEDICVKFCLVHPIAQAASSKWGGGGGGRLPYENMQHDRVMKQ